EGAEALVERTLLVDDVESARLLGRELNELGGKDLQTGLLETADDLPRHAPGDGVGLDDGQGALHGHRSRVLRARRRNALARAMRRVQLQGGARGPHARRTPCTLRVR